MKENRKRGTAKAEFDGLEVELKAGKRQLKGAPQERLKEMILLVLKEQVVRTKFNVFLDKETHSGITHKVDWVEVQKICRETPGIGVIIKIGFIGTDQVWWCKIQIPVCISVDRHAGFLSIIKNIAEEKCSRTRTPAEVNETGREDATPPIQDLPPEPPREEVISEDTAEVASAEAEMLDDVIADPAVGEVETSVPDALAEEGIDASIPEGLSSKERGRYYRKIFFQAIIEAFIRIFVEKAGSPLAPVSREGLSEILKELKLKNLNEKGAIRHLIERSIISKSLSMKKSLPCIWLTESARNMLIVKEADGDGLLETISDLQRELEIAKGQIEMLQEQNAEKDNLLLTISKNITLRQEVFIKLGSERNDRRKKVLNGILDECEEFDENIIEQITQIVGE